MPNEKIKFLKVRDVNSPKRAYQFDAGIDFFVPKFTPKFIEDLKEINPDVFGQECNYSGQIVGYASSQTLTLTNESSGSNVKWDLSDDNDTAFKFDEKTGSTYFLLSPGQRIMIPSGIKSRMAEPGRALIAANKSGVATKKGLVFGAQVVDYTYKGEIHLSLINTSTKVVRIYEDDKILQFLETPVFTSEVVIETADDIEKHEKEFYKGLQDDRKDGGFGSTDKK